jgi:hypothetical protein
MSCLSAVAVGFWWRLWASSPSVECADQDEFISFGFVSMTLTKVLSIAGGLLAFYWAIGRLIGGYRVLRDQTYSYSKLGLFSTKIVQRNGKHTRPQGVGYILSGIVGLVIISWLLLTGERDGLSLILYPILAGATLFELPGQLLSERHFPKE